MLIGLVLENKPLTTMAVGQHAIHAGESIPEPTCDDVRAGKSIIQTLLPLLRGGMK